MAEITNTSTGRLVLPDGRGFEPGESLTVDAAVLDYPVVSAWVENSDAALADGAAPDPERKAEEKPLKGEKK